jgi:hypothetical protein
MPNKSLFFGSPEELLTLDKPSFKIYEHTSVNSEPPNTE